MNTWNGIVHSSTAMAAWPAVPWSRRKARDLQSGAGPVWLRVAAYWRDASLLQQMGGYPGCQRVRLCERGRRDAGAGLPGFVVDQPWSAAFISWTMQRAGVPGFLSSPSHFDYVRAARRNPQGSPYLFLDPQATVPATGDMLCYVRTSRVYGHAGLAEAIDGGAKGLKMHCDIVVAANPGGDSRAYLVGGNVQQAVTMRRAQSECDGSLLEPADAFAG